MASIESGLDRQPRSESVRLKAVFAYVPLVAPFLLFTRTGRDVRLVRFHAVQALGLAAMLVLGLLAASACSLVLGMVGWMGLWLNVLMGLLIIVLLLGVTGLTFHGAWAAYQGTYTRVPWLTPWVWQRVNWLAPSAVPPRRRRRRSEEVRNADGSGASIAEQAFSLDTVPETGSEAP